MFEENEKAERPTEELKAEVINLIMRRISVSEDIGTEDVPKILEVLDHLDEDLKNLILAAFPKVSCDLLRKRLGVPTISER